MPPLMTAGAVYLLIAKWKEIEALNQSSAVTALRTAPPFRRAFDRSKPSKAEAR